MKILVSGYFKMGNFGDELILEIFKNRFPYKFSYVKSRKNIFKILKFCFKNDNLIFPGGGVFQQETGFFTVYYYMFLVFLFLLRRKRVFLINQGFGKMGFFTKKIFLFLLKRVNFISTRDISSFNMVRDTGSKVLLGADTAFHLDGLKRKEKKYVLIIPRGDEKLWITVSKNLRKFFTERVYIIPFQKKRDFELSTKIKKEVSDSEIFLWRGIDDVLSFFKVAKFVIASCYHAVLLSILFQIPFVAVFYNRKVVELLKEFSLEERVLYEEKNLEEIFKKSMDDFEISNIIYKIKEREKRAFEEFLKCFHT